MPLGYDRPLYILAFDHRGSFQKKMFGISGEPDAEQTRTIADAKTLIFEGFQQALADGAPRDAAGVLVDEQFGTEVARTATRDGLLLAMPVEASGRDDFMFEYGDQFGDHIEDFDPAFSKVLVRWNPAGDAQMNAEQGDRLKQLSDWLHEHDRKFLFELLVPATDEQLATVDGSTDRYDTELRPDLMVEAITEIQELGIEPDIWKIEGVDERSDCQRIAETTRRDGRDGVACVVLGRGADDAKVDHWLRAGSGVPGYIGFAIGRSIWWDAVKAYLDKGLEREAAAKEIAANYRRFIDVYQAG